MIGTEADFINKAGFAESVDVNWFTSDVYQKKQKSEFSRTTEKIVWFMVFRNGAFIGDTQFTARWHAPNGQLYREQRFSQVSGNWMIATTELFIAGEQASSLPGRWRIEIFYNDQLIAHRAFQLL